MSIRCYELSEKEIQRLQLEKIVTAKQYYEEQKQVVKKAKQIEKLFYADLVDSVRNSKSAYEYIDLETAFKQFSSPHKDSKQGQLEYAISKVAEDFIPNSVVNELNTTISLEKSFQRIAGCGLENYCFQFYFEIAYKDFFYNSFNTTLIIQIPRLIRLTADNFIEANEGKFVALVQTDAHNMRVIGESYEIEELQKIIATYLTPKIKAV